MSEMIERVERAIVDAGYNPATAKNIARIAIEAMREPTEVQLTAARDWSIGKYGKSIGNDGAQGCWEAMIKAVLS